MNYRHLYHAGNFADVFKHTLLISLLNTLRKKEKPFCYFETHAGRGQYDLQTEAALKTEEFRNGIEKLYHCDIRNLHPVLIEYIEKIQTWNPTKLRYYPGSPVLARSCLRASDRMILAELHSEEATLLKRCFSQDTAVAVHHLDGYQALKALLPPPIRRGLIFIDPPFEKTNEFEAIANQLSIALTRFPVGIYAIWYPIKDKIAVEHFYQVLYQVAGSTDCLRCEISLNTPENALTKALDACGMTIIHPPWLWREQAEAILTNLCTLLSPFGTKSIE